MLAGIPISALSYPLFSHAPQVLVVNPTNVGNASLCARGRELYPHSVWVVREYVLCLPSLSVTTYLGRTSRTWLTLPSISTRIARSVTQRLLRSWFPLFRDVRGYLSFEDFNIALTPLDDCVRFILYPIFRILGISYRGLCLFTQVLSYEGSTIICLLSPTIPLS
jgi:hypothetical protein